MAGIRDVLNFIFGSSGATGDADDELVAATVEAIVDQVEPKVRMHSGYQRKLAPAVRCTLAHLRALGRELPGDVRILARAGWAQDPHLNAFFATADDVPACLGRSPELRTLFQQTGAAEAFALLAMRLEERRILAPKLEGGELTQDVAQTSVSFTAHRLFAPSLSVAETRREVGRRLFVRLAQVALQHIIAADERSIDLEQRKGYLNTRLRLLNLAKDGMEGVVQDPATLDEQIRSAERELKTTVDEYIETKSSIVSLDRYIDRINDVLQHPQAHLQIAHTPMRVNRLGIKLEPGEDATANDLALTELVLGDTRAVIELVRCPRNEMPAPEDLIAKAERYL
jgi:hypothetical protein